MRSSSSPKPAQSATARLEQLRHVIDDVSSCTPGPQPLRLDRDLSLGQVLAALASATENATVILDGEPPRTCSASALRSRILADLEAAAADDRPTVPPQSTNITHAIPHRAD